MNQIRELVKTHFKDKGFYVYDGLKYGLDFLLYTSHPNDVHSKYGIKVSFDICFQELVALQRVCNSNNKEFVLCLADKQTMGFKTIKVSRLLNSVSLATKI